MGSQRVVGWGEKLPPKVPLKLVLCGGCDLLQLKDTTNPNLLWGKDYGYRSGVNQTMVAELTEIARSTEAIGRIQDDDIVIDIGCNDGTLLSAYEKRTFKIGYDPSENMAKFAREAGHSVIYDYFHKERYPCPRKAKAITAISMFYDLDDPNKFVADVAEVLHPEGVFVVQQNYLRGMIEQCAFDNICHEHVEYYSLKSLEPLLKRHGLEVIDVTTNGLNGGSFRVYAFKEGVMVPSTSVEQMRQAEEEFGFGKPDIYKDFAQRAELTADRLYGFVRGEVEQGKKVYAYGASTRGGTLLQFARLDSRLITGAADRNPDKWGKIMQSTGIPIVSEEEARAKADIFVVLPWFFANGANSEFVKREEDFISRGGKLVVPLPSFTVYDRH